MRNDGDYIPNRHGDVVTNEYEPSQYEIAYDEGFRDGVRAEKERQKAAAEAAKRQKEKDHGSKQAS